MSLAGSAYRLLTSAGRLAVDVQQTLRLLREVEAARWQEGPAALVARLRERGLRTRPRSDGERRQLNGVIARLDRVVEGGPNCYRRSLVRIALDRDAAAEPFVLGLDLPGAAPHGHAWVEGTGETSTKFDVEFRL